MLVDFWKSLTQGNLIKLCPELVINEDNINDFSSEKADENIA